MSTEKCNKKYPLVVFLTLFAISLGFSFRLQSVLPPKRKGVYFVPAPEYVERISGSFKTSFALAAYMKGALELADKPAEKQEELLALFWLAFKLDPKLVDAAFYGGVVTPVREEFIPRAIEFLKRAEALSPEQWRLPYWIGYSYLLMENNEKCAEYYLKASQLPGALPFLRYAAVNILSRDTSIDNAIIQTEGLYQSVDSEDAQEWVLRRLNWLRKMQGLETLAKEFKRVTGSFPESLEELVKTGMIQEIPHDEFGGGFYLTQPGDPEKGYEVRSDYLVWSTEI